MMANKAIPCYMAGCQFSTPETTDAVGAVMLGHHMSMAHPPVAATAPAAAAAGAARPERTSIPKPTRPVMKEDANDQDWMSFKYEWNQYKLASGITDVGQVRNELQFCCEPALTLLLMFRFI